MAQTTNCQHRHRQHLHLNLLIDLIVLIRRRWRRRSPCQKKRTKETVKMMKNMGVAPVLVTRRGSLATRGVRRWPGSLALPVAGCSRRCRHQAQL